MRSSPSIRQGRASPLETFRLFPLRARFAPLTRGFLKELLGKNKTLVFGHDHPGRSYVCPVAGLVVVCSVDWFLDGRPYLCVADPCACSRFAGGNSNNGSLRVRHKASLGSSHPFSASPLSIAIGICLCALSKDCSLSLLPEPLDSGEFVLAKKDAKGFDRGDCPRSCPWCFQDQLMPISPGLCSCSLESEAPRALTWGHGDGWCV